MLTLAAEVTPRLGSLRDRLTLRRVELRRA